MSTSMPEGSALPVHETLTGNRVESSTWKSRTLYNGDSIAACNAQPRATLSSEFMVVESSLPPKHSEHKFFTHGTLELPPTISTESTCSGDSPDAAMADSNTARARAIAGAHIRSKSSRVTWPDKSSSSIKHSQVIPASVLADNIFFVFVTESSSLNDALLLLKGSQPTFALNWAANSRIKHSSKSRPPTLSDRSQTTRRRPRQNWTIETEKIELPIEQNATVMGFSGSKSFDL
mmetsp:Transcript_85045/g.245926  ORF Transcript_85045/g.245926 Transcript_85045/m.245926 type:complete len:234 (+) Transcript_85045:1322-2023(+)